MAPSSLILVLVTTISLFLLLNHTSILPCPSSAQQTESHILHRQSQALDPVEIISVAFDAIILDNFIVKKKKKKSGHPSLPKEDEHTMWHWHLFNNELTPTRVVNVHPSSVHASVHTSPLSNGAEIFVHHRAPRRFLVNNNALPTWPGILANGKPYPHNTQKIPPSGGDTSSSTPSVPLPQFPTLGPPMVWSFPSPPNVIPPPLPHDHHLGHHMPLYPGFKNPYIATPPRTRKHSHYEHHILCAPPPTDAINAAEPVASPSIGEERAPQPVSGGPLPLP